MPRLPVHARALPNRWPRRAARPGPYLAAALALCPARARADDLSALFDHNTVVSVGGFAGGVGLLPPSPPPPSGRSGNGRSGADDNGQ